MLMHPARLDEAAQVAYESAMATILTTSRYRVADGWAARAARVVALGPDWGVLPLRSGTDALVRALRLSGVGPRDEVVVPDLAFHAVASSVLEIGARPVLADIDPESWNLCPTSVASLIGPRTTCVIAVDNYGTPVDLGPIAALTRKAGVPLVLDACESLGAEYPDGGPDRFADLVVTSFSFTKPVHAAGMGGALCGPIDAIESVGRSPLLLGPQFHLPEPTRRTWWRPGLHSTPTWLDSGRCTTRTCRPERPSGARRSPGPHRAHACTARCSPPTGQHETTS